MRVIPMTLNHIILEMENGFKLDINDGGTHVCMSPSSSNTSYSWIVDAPEISTQVKITYHAKGKLST